MATGCRLELPKLKPRSLPAVWNTSRESRLVGVQIPSAPPHFGRGTCSWGAESLWGALCWGRGLAGFHTHLFTVTEGRDESLKGGQGTPISLGHKSDSNLYKQSLVLVLDKHLGDKIIHSNKSQSVFPDGQWFFWTSPFFLMVPGNSRAGRVVWTFRCFGTWFYFRVALVVWPGSVGTATFSCSTTKCAQPSSELLDGHLQMVVTHLMVPCLSLALLICVSSAAVVSWLQVRGIQYKHFTNWVQSWAQKPSLEGSPELIELWGMCLWLLNTWI